VLILIAGIIVAAGIIWITHALSEMVRTLSFV